MKNSTVSHKIGDNLYLTNIVLDQERQAVPAVEAVNHIVVIDVSGSMYGELPRIRQQLKAKLPTLMSVHDTLTLIWFSGRGQFGVLVEAEPVRQLTDLQAINKAIDRWLSPISLTGFKEPLELVSEVIFRVRKKGNKGAFSLFFMSDGCDNQWPQQDILRAVSNLASECSAATFVEYGYYADRKLLSEMAEMAGGQHIFAEKFEKYEPLFEQAMAKEISGGKKVEVTIENGWPIGGFAYAIDGQDLLTFRCEMVAGRMTVLIPEQVSMVSFLSEKSVGKEMYSLQESVDTIKLIANPAMSGTNTVARAYAALSLFSVRMRPDIIYPILKALGDVSFIDEFGACFGKQRYSSFMERARLAAFDVRQQRTRGWDPDRLPPDNAFTVLELLEILTSDDDVRVLFDHPEWKYNLIGRAEVQDEGQLKFIADPKPDGYPISSLTLNEERPNISMLIRKEGTVDLDRVKGRPAKLPKQFPTFIFRNYTLVRDGVVNVDKLVVRVKRDMYSRLAGLLETHAIWSGTGDDIVGIIFLSELPVINRRMVKAASAKTLFDLEWELTKLRAKQKVYNSITKDLFPKESKAYKLVYGEEAADWLASFGVTDYNGFNPHTTDEEATDFYMGRKLDVRLKGYASLPSVKEVQDKVSVGRAPKTGGGSLMVGPLEEVGKILNTAGKAQIKQDFLEGTKKATTAQVRSLLFQKAQQVFSVIVGQVWFDEFETINDTTMEITKDEKVISASVEMKEFEIHI